METHLFGMDTLGLIYLFYVYIQINHVFNVVADAAAVAFCFSNRHSRKFVTDKNRKPEIFKM